MANYKIKNERSDAIVREDEIYDWLVNKDNAAICDYKNDPFRFVRKIICHVEQFIDFTHGRGNDGQTSLAWTVCSGSAAGHSAYYVLLLAASSFPKPLFDHFVRQLEIYYIFTKTPDERP
jgi:hypothetical protein